MFSCEAVSVESRCKHATEESKHYMSHGNMSTSCFRTKKQWVCVLPFLPLKFDLMILMTVIYKDWLQTHIVQAKSFFF